MGEQADLMINGDVCSGCGEEMGDGDGFSRYCAGCAPDYPRAPKLRTAMSGRFLCSWPPCLKSFKTEQGRVTHERALHPHALKGLGCGRCQRMFATEATRAAHRVSQHKWVVTADGYEPQPPPTERSEG